MLVGVEWAEDADWYIGHALDHGLKPSPGEVLELADWSYGSISRLVTASEGAFSQKQLTDLLDMVDEQQAKGIVRHAVARGTKLDDAGMCEVCGYFGGDTELADALVARRVAEKGPYTAAELCPAFNQRSITEYCSHKSGVCEVSVATKLGYVKYSASPSTKYRESCHNSGVYEVNRPPRHECETP